MKEIKVLVCGPRNFKDLNFVYTVLDGFNKIIPICGIIEGGASGVDSMAYRWANNKGIPWYTFPAKWDKYGKAAGPIRNKKMLVEGKPDLVIAIKTGNALSRGTANMVKLAKEAGVVVHIAKYGGKNG